MTTTLDLPGVGIRARPRPRPAPRVRTDVVGFVGFESRLRPDEAAFDPKKGQHRVAVLVDSFRCEIDTVTTLVEARDRSLVLSSGAGPLLADGESMVFTVAAALLELRRPIDRDRGLPVAELVVVAGAPSPAVPVTPGDGDVDAEITARIAANSLPPTRAWRRVADVSVRADGGTLWTTVLPRLGTTSCEDWCDFELLFGTHPDGGMRLAESVRAFFANGGRRCLVTTVRRPVDSDVAQLEEARHEMVGRLDAPWSEATGVAALKLGEEVSIVACPDLHARRSQRTTTTVTIPPDAGAADFRPCGPEAEPAEPIEGVEVSDEPLFGSVDDVVATQAALLALASKRPFGVQIVLTAPAHRDPGSGRFGPPGADDANTWRAALVGSPGLTDGDLSFGAAYWPWIRSQAGVGIPPLDSPPMGAAAGVMAGRDVERGPFVAPANATVNGAVGLTMPVDDRIGRRLYDPSSETGQPTPGAVNLLRPRQNRGIELWGSRTLAADRWLRHLPIRRGLSAIERRAVIALRELVFEPNTPMLWLRVTHLLTEMLFTEFERGGLRGNRPEDAFFVRCDEHLNTADDMAKGRMFCEVGVAIAAPAEYIMFRLGRIDGAIEVVEP